MNIFAIIVASVFYAISINFFIVPCGLYNGGFLGAAQVIRTAVETLFGYEFTFDISGIISFVLNLLLLSFTRKALGNKFIAKSLFCVAFQSLLLSVIPIRNFIDNVLTSVIVGGILCGASIGLLLKYGGSSGGVDIIGMYLAKKGNFTVGKINVAVDAAVFIAVLLLINNLEKTLYSLIFAVICSLSIDRTHSQNINCEVVIISKAKYDEIKSIILTRINRGFSYWRGCGGFSDDENNIIYVVLSKYELPQLRKYIVSIDPSAFISIKHNISVIGNFEKRL